MAKITINRENFKVEERELEQGSLTIGRAHDNLLHIDDAAVSGHHAQIVTVFESAYVEDLGSTNGTFVNGEKIKTHTLHNGDVLTIGHYQILFQSETSATSTSIDTEDPNATMMIGVSQLEELTKKARGKDAAQTQQKSSSGRPARQTVAHSAGHTAVPKNTASIAGKPKLKVHENDGQPLSNDSTNNTRLPDIDDKNPLLDQTQNISASPPMFNRRKSDTSVLPSLKVIALAVLATVATFTVLMLIFK